MTLEELKTRHQNQPWQEAVVLFDRLSMEWVVDFRGPDDGLHPLTDAKGCRVSFADEQVAEAAIALAEAYAQYGEYAHYEPDADEYPMHIEELYRREDALVAARRRYEETCRG